MACQDDFPRVEVRTVVSHTEIHGDENGDDWLVVYTVDGMQYRVAKVEPVYE